MLHSQSRDIVGAAPGDHELGPSLRHLARRLRRPALAPVQIGLIAALIDLVAVGLALWFADLALQDGGALSRSLFATLGGVVAVGIVQIAGGYRLSALRRFATGTALMIAAGLVGALVFGVGQGGTDAGVPERLRLVLGVPLMFLGVAAAGARALSRTIAAWAVDFGLTERRAVVVGGGVHAARLIDGLAANPANDIRICAIFDDRGDDRSPAVITGIPKLGTTQDLLPFAREAEIDMVIVALPLTAETRIRQVLAPLEVLPLDIRLSAYSADMTFPRRQGRARSEGALLSLVSRPLADWDVVVKRAFDLLGAVVALALFAVPMAVVAMVIRLDSPGPVFFRQQRHGYNHRPITVWKFRSMRSGDCDSAAARVVTRGDARVTRIGRFIRSTSLDELPQLFNVLAGDLSLVGPRPHALVALSSRQVAFAEMVDGYAARHRMRPGITGWAQISGWRGEIDDPEKLRRRFEHDLYYIENWSIWLDIRILALTPLSLLDTRNAY